MENYSRRENLKFFGLPENIDASFNSMNVEEGLPRQRDASENTKEIIYKILEDQLKIDRPREKNRVSESAPFRKAKPSKVSPHHREVSPILRPRTRYGTGTKTPQR